MDRLSLHPIAGALLALAECNWNPDTDGVRIGRSVVNTEVPYGQDLYSVVPLPDGTGVRLKIQFGVATANPRTTTREFTWREIANSRFEVTEQ